MPNLKIISNLDCLVYIDGEQISEVKNNVITKIPLEIGEYIFEAVSSFHDQLRIKKLLFIQYDKVLSIDLLGALRDNPTIATSLEFEAKENNGLWGYYIKGTSVNIIPCQYEEAHSFVGDYAIVRKGSLGVIDKQGKTILDFIYYGIDILECSNEVNPIPVGFQVQKDAPVVSHGHYNYNNHGFSDLTGRLIIPFDYFEFRIVGHFILGHADYYNVNYNNYSLFDFEGNLLLKGRMIEALGGIGTCPPILFCNDKGRYGILDYKLNPLVPIVFGGYHDFYPGNNYELSPDRYHGVIMEDKEDNIEDRSIVIIKKRYVVKILDPDFFDCIYEETNNGATTITSTSIVEYSEYALTKRKCLEKGIEENDRFYYQFEEDDLINHSFLFIDCRGQEVVLEGIEEMYDYYCGTAVVKKNGLYGMINHLGKEIIPCEFETIYDGSGGSSIGMNFVSEIYITVVDHNGDMGLFDRKGHCVCPIKPGQRIQYGTFEPYFLT